MGADFINQLGDVEWRHGQQDVLRKEGRQVSDERRRASLVNERERKLGVVCALKQKKS